MKKLILLCMFTVLSMAYDWDNYGDNYQEGYKDGYTYNEGGLRSIAPIPPIPPIPRIGETPHDSYIRGVLDGQENNKDY